MAQTGLNVNVPQMGMYKSWQRAIEVVFLEWASDFVKIAVSVALLQLIHN